MEVKLDPSKFSDSEIKERINQSINTVLGKTITDFESEESLFESLQMESIEFVDFIFEVERSLSCELNVNLLLQNSNHFSSGRYGTVSPKGFLNFVKKNLQDNHRLI